jgi:predicted branched-subunit amino acid permease
LPADAVLATDHTKTWRSQFHEGFMAMLPLWAGAIPSGIAYGVAARAVGVGALDAQIMSLTVFTAAGQITAISLIGEGGRLITTFVTVMAVNAQIPLLGIAAARHLHPTRFQKLQLSLLLTDGAFGIAAARQPLRHYVLVGAGASMYLGWNIGTALGLTAGGAIGDPTSSGLDFVVPLSFLAVLVPLIRDRSTVMTVLAAAAVAVIVVQFAPIGVAILAAGIAGSAVGIATSRRPSRVAHVQ